MNTEIVCNSCGFKDTIDKYHLSMSVYSDIRCPECGSTNNEHNTEYQTRLFKAMNSPEPESR